MDDPHADAACSFCDEPKDKVSMLVFVKDRFYICDECVGDAAAAVEAFWENRWRDQGAIEYDSWGTS